MRRWGRLVGWAGLMMAVALIPVVVGWSNLPDPVASHWDFTGVPDNSMPV